MSKLKLAHAATFKTEVKIPVPAGEPLAGGIGRQTQ